MIFHIHTNSFSRFFAGKNINKFAFFSFSLVSGRRGLDTLWLCLGVDFDVLIAKN
jgi:hypothetical protein